MGYILIKIDYTPWIILWKVINFKCSYNMLNLMQRYIASGDAKNKNLKANSCNNLLSKLSPINRRKLRTSQSFNSSNSTCSSTSTSNKECKRTFSFSKLFNNFKVQIWKVTDSFNVDLFFHPFVKRYFGEIDLTLFFFLLYIFFEFELFVDFRKFLIPVLIFYHLSNHFIQFLLTSFHSSNGLFLSKQIFILILLCEVLLLINWGSTE